MKINKYQIQTLILMLLLVLSSCISLNQSVKPLTAKQQATIWMTVYNSIYDDTMAMAKNPTTTPAQKEMVAKKKSILTQIWPLLKVFVAEAEAGGTPSVESTQAISDLINQLTALAIGGN